MDTDVANIPAVVSSARWTKTPQTCSGEYLQSNWHVDLCHATVSAHQLCYLKLHRYHILHIKHNYEQKAVLCLS